MDLIGGPFLSFILDLLARTFVSWGILSAGNQELFVKLVNSVVVGVVMLIPSIIGISKIIDLKNLKINSHTTTKTTQDQVFTPEISQDTPAQPPANPENTPTA